MSISKGTFISPSITDTALKDTLQSLADAIEAAGLTVSNTDPDNSVGARGGRLWYNPTTSNLFIFSDMEWINIGAGGIRKVNLTIYRRTNGSVGFPSGGSYNFGGSPSPVLTPPSNWSITIPGGTDQLYSSSAVALGATATSIDSDLTWSSPVAITEGTPRVLKKVFYFATSGTPHNIGTSQVQATLTWNTGAFSSITGPTTSAATGGNWVTTQPTLFENSTTEQWQAEITFADPTGVAATTTAHTTNINRLTNFDGVVSFTDLSAEVGTTVIHGGNITTDTIKADSIDLTNGSDSLLTDSDFTGWINDNAGGNTSSQGTNPPASPATNDLWFNTNTSDNIPSSGMKAKRLHYWTGSAWSPFSLTADSIAANHITAGTFNADTITVENLEADNLKTNSITGHAYVKAASQSAISTTMTTYATVSYTRANYSESKCLVEIEFSTYASEASTIGGTATYYPNRMAKSDMNVNWGTTSGILSVTNNSTRSGSYSNFRMSRLYDANSGPQSGAIVLQLERVGSGSDHSGYLHLYEPTIRVTEFKR